MASMKCLNRPDKKLPKSLKVKRTDHHSNDMHFLSLKNKKTAYMEIHSMYKHW